MKQTIDFKEELLEASDLLVERCNNLADYYTAKKASNYREAVEVYSALNKLTDIMIKLEEVREEIDVLFSLTNLPEPDDEE